MAAADTPAPPAAAPTRPHVRFAVDAITQGLVRDGEDATTFGLNANLFDMEQPALREPYARLRAAMAAALEGCGAPYIYPFAHLHVTAASPAPFTGQELDAAAGERAAFEAAFIAAMRDECVPEKGFPSSPFPIVVGEQVRLDPTCGILLCGDPTGAVERVRACLRSCMTHTAVMALGAGVVARAAFKHPRIVHASFARFTAEPSAAVSDDEIAARFAAVAATWEPVTVMADALYLVREIRPYMHLHIGPRGGPAGPDAGCVALRVPYGAEGE